MLSERHKTGDFIPQSGDGTSRIAGLQVRLCCPACTALICPAAIVIGTARFISPEWEERLRNRRQLAGRCYCDRDVCGPKLDATEIRIFERVNPNLVPEPQPNPPRVSAGMMSLLLRAGKETSVMHCLKCSVPVLAAVLACSPSAHSQLPQAHPSRPLTTVAAVVERLSQKAPSGTAVRLRAQIAFVDPEWRLLFIRDTSGSSFVQLPPKTKMSPLRSGDVIQMTGRTSPGDVGPTILHPKIRVIARRPLAAPRALSLAAIQAGLANGQYVLTEGVIRPGPVVGNHTWLTLVDRNNATLIIIPGALSRSALALLGAHVLVRGISAVRRDDAERPIGHELFVQSVDDVRAQPSKWQGLFGSAVVSISAIRDSNVADRFATYHVGGRVLRKELDGFVIADASGSVEVRAAEAPAVARGSIVEVIGLHSSSMLPFLWTMHNFGCWTRCSLHSELPNRSLRRRRFALARTTNRCRCRAESYRTSEAAGTMGFLSLTDGNSSSWRWQRPDRSVFPTSRQGPLSRLPIRCAASATLMVVRIRLSSCRIFLRMLRATRDQWTGAQ